MGGRRGGGGGRGRERGGRGGKRGRDDSPRRGGRGGRDRGAKARDAPKAEDLVPARGFLFVPAVPSRQDRRDNRPPALQRVVVAMRPDVDVAAVLQDSPDAARVGYRGDDVVTVATYVYNDTNLRELAEDVRVALLCAEGDQDVAALSAATKEELTESEKLPEWLRGDKARVVIRQALPNNAGGVTVQACGGAFNFNGPLSGPDGVTISGLRDRRRDKTEDKQQQRPAASQSTSFKIGDALIVMPPKVNDDGKEEPEEPEADKPAAAVDADAPAAEGEAAAKSPAGSSPRSPAAADEDEPEPEGDAPAEE